MRFRMYSESEIIKITNILQVEGQREREREIKNNDQFLAYITEKIRVPTTEMRKTGEKA